MPEPRARSGSQRVQLTATRSAWQGRNEAEIVESLLAKYKWLSPAQALAHAQSAAISVQSGEEMTRGIAAKLGHDVEGAQRVGLLSGTGEVDDVLAASQKQQSYGLRGRDVTVIVEIPQSDGSTKYRQIRRFMPAGMGDLDIAAEIEELIEGWGSEYGASDQGVSWHVAYVI